MILCSHLCASEIDENLSNYDGVILAKAELFLYHFSGYVYEKHSTRFFNNSLKIHHLFMYSDISRRTFDITVLN